MYKEKICSVAHATHFKIPATDDAEAGRIHSQEQSGQLR